MAGEDLNLGPLDVVRRFFGVPTLMEQSLAAAGKLVKKPAVTPAPAPVAAPTGLSAVSAGMQGYSPTESRFNPGVGLRERQSTMDAAMAELRRQNGGQ